MAITIGVLLVSLAPTGSQLTFEFTLLVRLAKRVLREIHRPLLE